MVTNSGGWDERDGDVIARNREKGTRQEVMETAGDVHQSTVWLDLHE